MQSWQAAHLGLGSGSLDYSEAPCIRLWAPLSPGSSTSALRSSRSGAGSKHQPPEGLGEFQLPDITRACGAS